MKKTIITKTQGLLIPDCCNLGVAFRIVIFVNLVVFFCLLARGLSWLLMLQEFAETSILLEPICLLSLAALCALRQYASHHPVSGWLQRFACYLIPALFCGLLVAYFRQLEWFQFSFPRLHWGAATLLSLMMGVLVQHYFELRTQAYSPALGEAKLQVLQARIRPHFLYNSLNAVLSLIRSEPRRAEMALEDLADLFRVLMRDARDMTTLQDEIRLCEQYLAIEKIRLGNRLQVVWKMKEDSVAELNACKIPNLLLQPLLENAVHYGIEPAQTMGTIKIDIRRQLDKIQVSIRNPYHQDAVTSGGNHMALDNIEQRLALLYDIEANLHYGVREYQPDLDSTLHIGVNTAPKPSHYFEVLLQFPLRT